MSTTSTTDCAIQSGNEINISSTITISKSLTSLDNDLFRASNENKKSLDIDNLNSKLSSLEHVRESLANLSKLANIRVVKSLARSHSLNQVKTALTMYQCGKYISLKNGKYVVLNRCHKRLCYICNQIKSKQYSLIATKALSQMKYDLADECSSDTPSNKQMIGIKVTLNTGTACTLEHLRDRISILHRCFARLLRLTALKDDLIGSIRATEITQSNDDDDNTLANPHIHSLLLLRKDCDLSNIISVLNKYWPKAIKKQIARLRLQDSNYSSVAAFQQCEQLYIQSTDDAHSWLTYMTKGGYDLERDSHSIAYHKTSSNFWQAVDTAIKGMRLIASSGELKDAIALVKANLQKSELDTQLHSHVWSSSQSKYVAAEQYNPKNENIAFISSSLSYADDNQHIGYLFRDELTKHHDELMSHELEHIGSTLLNTQNHSLFEQKEYLFINKHKIAEHYAEPNEVERESLVIKRKQRIANEQN